MLIQGVLTKFWYRNPTKRLIFEPCCFVVIERLLLYFGLADRYGEVGQEVWPSVLTTDGQYLGQKDR